MLFIDYKNTQDSSKLTFNKTSFLIRYKILPTNLNESEDEDVSQQL